MAIWSRPGEIAPLSVPVFDAHAHVLHEGGQTAGANIMHDGDAAGMLEVNTWCGIDRVAMMSWSAPVCSDAHDGNEIVWRAMQRFGDEIVGVAVIDPTHMTQEEMEAEIRLRYLEQGFVGMKPYVQMNLSYEDEAFNTMLLNLLLAAVQLALLLFVRQRVRSGRQMAADAAGEAPLRAHTMALDTTAPPAPSSPPKSLLGRVSGEAGARGDDPTLFAPHS